MRRRALLLGLSLAVVLGLGFVVVRPERRPAPYDLPGVGHEKGKRSARVVVIEFADFSCPACAQFTRETLPRIEREWIATGRVRLRVIPFNALGSGWTAARAAECAAQQDAFWPMHERLFNRQAQWLGRLGRRGQYEEFTRWAVDLGLSATRFRACWDSDYWSDELKRNTQLARANGVPGTPAFVINGRPLVGALSYADFSAALEQATRLTVKQQPSAQ